MVAAVVVVGLVVAIPLFLKSRRGGAGEDAAPAAARTSVQPGPLPRFVDVGTTTCVPCRVMLGVMDELREKYPDSMVVQFVDIAVEPEEAARYQVRAIPSQVFYAPDGRELYRHVGVIRADDVVAKWAELGYEIRPRPEK